MIVTELELTNFRAYGTAKFKFRPGINLIAGVNGAGKSTVLDALRILLSRAMRQRYGQQQSIEETSISDIRRGADAYDLSVKFSARGGKAYEYVGHLSRQEVVTGLDGYARTASETTLAWRKRMRKLGLETDRSATIDRPDAFRFAGSKPEKTEDLGFALFFSPHRSLLSQEVLSKTAMASSYSQALSERRLNLRHLAEWWLAQEGLALERIEYQVRLDAVTSALRIFMPNFVSVRPRKLDEIADLEIWKLDSPFTRCNRFVGRDLSDGERGILALVLEVSSGWLWLIQIQRTRI